MFPVDLAQVLGWLCLALTCVAAAWRGGQAERLGAAVVGVAWFITALVERRHNWLEPQYGILAVDIVTLLALAAIALWARRNWAICAAGFQAIAVLTHLVFLINPQALYRAYYMSNFSIGFLLLGAIAAGVIFEASRRAPVSRR